MTKNMELFLEDPVKFVQELSPLVVILTSLGIIVTVAIFVLFYRNRNEDILIRRRFLILFALMLAHTLLFPLAYLTYENNLTLLWTIWFTLIPLLFFTNIFYFVQLYKRQWKNLGLLFATLAFGIYNAYLFLLTLFWGLLCFIISSINSATK